MKRANWLRSATTALGHLALTIIVGTTVVARAEAQSIQLVTSFTAPNHPDTALIQGTGSFLYGTLAGGGTDTVYKVLPNGTGFVPLATLQCATEGCAGQDSLGALLQVGNSLYGTRTNGGSPNNGGTIFEVNLLTLQARAIHVFQVNAQDAFTNDGNDGQLPSSGLILLSDGFLYGTTSLGGAFDRGAAYKIRPDGSGFGIIHSFNCVSDSNCAFVPASGMIQLSDGFLYGTTTGSSGVTGGVLNGTMYKLSTDGVTFQIIRSFINSNGGPVAGLAQGSDGFVYGTTADTGVAAAGTVYKILPDGTGFSTLHSFQGFPSDGGLPLGRLLQLSDDNFYGTTQRGGATDCGTVFRISPIGTYQLIDSFGVGSTGCFPGNGLTRASDGNLYGTAPGGALGTIFRVPVSIASGQAPVITSSNVATFNVGILSSFTVTTTASPTASLSETGILPNGVTFTDNGNGTGVLRGTAAANTAGNYPIVITATNGVLPNGTQNFALTVNGGFTADKGVVLGTNVSIGAGTHLGKNVSIGNDAVIGTNVTINQNVVIGAGARIGDNTFIDQNTRVGANSTIGANVKIGQSVQVAPNAIIPAGAVIPARKTVP
jgi:uncharacterized repeat protein (TIGR03803 family)